MGLFLPRAEYLFIHIPKNAGVAVRKARALERSLVAAEPLFHKSTDYTRRLKSTMMQSGEHHGYQHARLLDIHPKVRRRLQPVAVVRNPWSRTVSRFRFAQHLISQGKVAADYAAKDFEAFLEERHRFGGKDFYWHRAIRGWFPQRNYVVDEQGEIAVHVLRQEQLDAEAMRYFGLSEELPKRNVTGNSSRSYQDYYNDKTIQIVADWYQCDIETFGFDFNSSATRNCFFSDAA